MWTSRTGFGFEYDLLRGWLKISGPITEWGKAKLMQFRIGHCGLFSLEVWHRLGLVTAWFISYRPHNDCWSVLIAANQLFHDFSVMFQGFFTEVITDKKKEKKEKKKRVG